MIEFEVWDTDMEGADLNSPQPKANEDGDKLRVYER